MISQTPNVLKTIQVQGLHQKLKKASKHRLKERYQNNMWVISPYAQFDLRRMFEVIKSLSLTVIFLVYSFYFLKKDAITFIVIKQRAHE